MTQFRNKQIKFDSNIAFDTLLKVTNLANGTATNDAVNYSQLQAVEAMIASLEFQDSAITSLNYIKTTAGAPSTTGATTGEVLLNTNNNTLYTSTSGDTWDAGVALTAGQRYIFKANGTGTGTGIVATANNNIYESNGSAVAATTPTTGMIISVDDENTALYYFGGSSWVVRYFEASTASTGLVKVGFDIRLDPSSAVFIEAAQDAVGAAATNSARITLTYNDGANTITADLVANSINEDYLLGLGTGTAGQVVTSDGALGFTYVNADTLKPTEKRVFSASAVTTGDAQLSVTDVFGTDNPRNETFPLVFINGKACKVAASDATRTSSEVYFGTSSGTATAVTALTAAENLYVNGTVLGYDLDASDEVIVQYSI